MIYIREDTNYHMQTLVPEGRKTLEKTYPELFKNYRRIDEFTYAFSPFKKDDIDGLFGSKEKIARLTGRWYKQIDTITDCENELLKYAEAIEQNCGNTVESVYFSALDDNDSIRYEYTGNGSLEDKLKKAKNHSGRNKQSAYTFRNMLYIIVVFRDTENEYFGSTPDEYRGNHKDIMSNLYSNFLDIDRLIDSAVEATWSPIREKDAERLKEQIEQYKNGILYVLSTDLRPL